MKWLLVIFIIIVLFVVIVIIFISPITKYLIEKYDEKYAGRQITIDWLVLNPFTGYIHIDGLKVFESKSDSVFFSADGISVNIAVLKLVFGTYKVDSYTLTNPMAKVIRDGDRFNFTDILEKFSGKKEEVDPPKKPDEPLKFYVKDILIEGGTFHYIEKNSSINYFIKKTRFESKEGFSWDIDTVSVDYYLEPGTGSGSIEGNFAFNLKSQVYRFAILIKKFDLAIFEQYLDEISNYASFSANLDADLKAKGNLNNQLNFDASGFLAVNDFHFGKEPGDDYASFEKFIVSINKLNPKNEQYVFDSIIIRKPYFKYEKYDTLDNVSKMFGKGGSNIKEIKENPKKFNLILELVDFVGVLAKNFLHSYYKINKFSLEDADFRFNDYSLRDKFSISMSPFNILADSMDRNLKKVNIDIWSGIKPYGKFNFTLTLDPGKNDNFNMNYKMEKVASSMFNPYLVTYTSFPLDRGSIEFYGNTKVNDGNINSINHFVVIDPRNSERVRKKDASWIPMPLIMAFVRERGNVIDYEIPVKGNINDPKFSITDILLDLLKNIFVKPATTGYRMEVKNVEQEVEKSMRISFQMRQKDLVKEQEKFLEKIVDFVKDEKEVSIEIEPVIYEEKEKEQILLFLAKKEYFLASKGMKGKLYEEDSLEVDKMSSKDGGFLKYLNQKVKDSMIFTVQGKCMKIIDKAEVNNYYKNLIEERKRNFYSQFQKEGVENRVKFGASRTSIPYDGFSFFAINYKGDYPDDVKKAFAKLNELNMEKPRNKFLKGHKSTLERILNR